MAVVNVIEHSEGGKSVSRLVRGFYGVSEGGKSVSRCVRGFYGVSEGGKSVSQ